LKLSCSDVTPQPLVNPNESFAVAKRTNASGPDNLRKIEGIGPKIAKLLVEDGIDSFAKLANASIKRLKKILKEAGPRFKLHDPTSWKEQAALAAKGKWEDLAALQRKLHGGRKKKKKTSRRSTRGLDKAAIGALFSANDDHSHEKPLTEERILTPAEVDHEYAKRRRELDKEFAQARGCAEALWKKLQKLDEFEEHITGISVGYRTKFGQVVSPLKVVVAVNVDRKLSDAEMKELGYTSVEECCCTLPKKLVFETKVLEGRFVLLEDREGFFLRGLGKPKAALPFSSVVTGGVPIHRPADPLSVFGTLGVVSVAPGRAATALTAQHVVGTERVVEQIDDEGNDRPIGSVPNVKIAPHDVSIGGLIESIDAAVINLVDDPAVLLPNPGEWSRGIPNQVLSDPSAINQLPVYYSKRRMVTADKGLTLLKFGNGSGKSTFGKIERTKQTANIFGMQFKNNFTIKSHPNNNTAFATPGDSGSIIIAGATKVNGQQERAIIIVGILFAGLTDTTMGLACNMSTVVKGLNLEQTLKGSKFAKTWS